jgi:hypothetical protein
MTFLFLKIIQSCFIPNYLPLKNRKHCHSLYFGFQIFPCLNVKEYELYIKTPLKRFGSARPRSMSIHEESIGAGQSVCLSNPRHPFSGHIKMPVAVKFLISASETSSSGRIPQNKTQRPTLPDIEPVSILKTILLNIKASSRQP